MLTTFIISFVVVFIISFICETFSPTRLINSIVSFFISLIISLLIISLEYIIDKDNKRNLQKCKETVSLIIPEIVYANDSSFKVLKYNHRNFPEKIIINFGDSLYNMNDSDYIVEPCSQTILKKRK